MLCAPFQSYSVPRRAKQHLVQGQRYTGKHSPCRPLACLIRGQKRPLECGCTLESVAESPCAGALGRLAALFPNAGPLCSSTQARPSCPRPQGCSNSAAGQRLCIFKQPLKRSLEARRLSLWKPGDLRSLPKSLTDWIKGYDDKEGWLKALSFICGPLLLRGSWVFEADGCVFARMFWLLDVLMKGCGMLGEGWFSMFL